MAFNLMRKNVNFISNKNVGISYRAAIIHGLMMNFITKICINVCVTSNFLRNSAGRYELPGLKEI